MRDEPLIQFRRLLLPLLGVLMVTSCGSGSSTPSDTTPAPLPPAQADHAFFGVHDGSLNSLKPDTGVGSLRVWDAGVSWREVETAQGSYDWTNLDRIVTAAQQDGVQVTLVLALTPPFYSPDPTKPPPDTSAYRNYLTAVMQRYRDFRGSRGISSYQVWNEGNVVNSWTGTQAQLAELTKVAYDVRNKVDPQAKLVAPPMAVRLPTQQTWLRKYYAQQVDGRPVWKYVDIIALNLYPLDQYGKDPGTPEDTVKLLDLSREQLKAGGVPDSLPIWNTEVNYGLKGAATVPHAVAIPEALQAAYVVRTYLLNAAYGVSRVFWYRWDWGLLDSSIGGGTIGNTLMTDPTDYAVRSQAGRSLGVVEHWLTDDSAKAPSCSKDSSGTYSCRIDYAGGTRWVYWNPTAQAQVTLPAGATVSQGVSGRSAQVTGGSSLDVDYSPVMVDSSH